MHPKYRKFKMKSSIFIHESGEGLPASLRIARRKAEVLSLFSGWGSDGTAGLDRAKEEDGDQMEQQD
mgnify:CR=1 FL=1